MKKVLSAILAAALAVGLMAVPAYALDDGVEINREEIETDGESILELSEFDASRSTSEAVRKEIFMMNSDIARTIGSDVREARYKLADEDDSDWFNIRSFTYETDKYLQIIATSISYPIYGYDPYTYSWVYDRTAKKYVHLSDALIEDGLTESEIIEDAEKLYAPEYYDIFLFGGKVLGFYMADDNTRSYIIYMNLVNPAAEEWQYLMTYTPGKYTEDGKAQLFQHVTVGETFTPEKEEPEEFISGNSIKYGVKYEDADGNYIRFIRDKTAVVKLGEKLDSWNFYNSEGNIDFNMGSTNYKATLEKGTTLKVAYDGKDYTLTAAE
ncbi:MAG: hypothetical protein LBL98_04105 [Ruminococcus sp.]|jgi:hypothetical protein|nr:hypothetical protein [Ruminococcus sp.]